LVIDEVLAVGDERFQRKCMDKIREFQEAGKTIIFVTQAPEQVRQICNRAMVLSKGNVLAVGDPGHSIRQFRESLLEAGEGPGATVVEVSPEGEEAERTIDFVPKEEERPLHITDVRLTYPDQSMVPHVRSGDPVAVHVGFVADKPLSDVVFSLVVTDPRGETLISTTTEHMKAIYEVDAGEGELVFTFSSWPLLDGNYLVSVGVQSRLGGTVYDWKEDAVGIEVLYDGQAGGLLNLPLTVAMPSGGASQGSAS